MGYRRQRERALTYNALDHVFQHIHNRACRALIYPFQLGLLDWLKPQLDAEAENAFVKIAHAFSDLHAADPTIKLNPKWTQFNRRIALNVRRPKGIWYANGDMRNAESRGRMSLPQFDVEVQHYTTYGNSFVTAAFGMDIPAGTDFTLTRGDTAFGHSTFPPELKEVFDFTMASLETIFSRLDQWYVQFSTRQDGEWGPNTITGPENYHRIAAAMYYSPVFNQWVQFLDESGNLKLAPTCKKLSRSNRFSYDRAMEIELSSVLSTALTLAQSQNMAEEEKA